MLVPSKVTNYMWGQVTYLHSSGAFWSKTSSEVTSCFSSFLLQTQVSTKWISAPLGHCSWRAWTSGWPRMVKTSMVQILQSCSTPGLSSWLVIFKSQQDRPTLWRGAGTISRWILSQQEEYKKYFCVCMLGNKEGEQPPVSLDGFCTSLNTDFLVCKARCEESQSRNGWQLSSWCSLSRTTAF